MIKKKILHIQLLPILSGVQNAMLYLIENLPENEYEISVLSAPGGPLRDVVQKMGMKHIALPGLKRLINFYDLVVLIRFYRVCRKFKFDLVHTHSSKTGLLGRIAAKIAGTKVVVHTVQGFPFHGSQPRLHQYFYQILEKLGGYFCDMAVSVNEYERKLAIKKHILPPNKIITIHNGIEKPTPQKKISRQQLGFKRDDVIVGEIARFSQAKNIIELIKISIEITKQHENIKFVYVGDGELWNQSKEIVMKARADADIILPGWDSDIGAWNELFDISVSFSLWEGLSLSILEALACGRPIVASNIKGNNELVEHGVNGFLIKNHEKYEFIDKISFLAEKNEIRNRMGEQSLRIFEQNFTVENYQKKYNQLYQKLFSEKL